MKWFLIIAGVGMASACAPANVSSDAGEVADAEMQRQRADEAHRYQGTYRFEDGTRITGGRMDESGKSMLSYLDVWNVERGGVFEAADEGYTGVWGTTATLRFEDNGEVMLWQEPSGKPMRATRITRPQQRPADFSNAGLKLAGTLYLPPDRGDKAPAIILAHGSGPSNRYAGPWVTFFVSEGYAVLAFDKRGTGESGGDWKSVSYLDLAADLSAAAEWLAKQPDIEGSRIGLKTSSQSGWYGPYALQLSDNLSFLIQRAAPAVNIGIGTAHEIEHDLRREGVPEDHIEPLIDFWITLHELAGEGGNLEAANERFESIKDQPWFETAFGDWDGIPPDWWARHAANMRLEPADATAELEQPVLWFLADQDENVPYEESMTALREAQREKANLAVVTVHDAKHNFLVSDADGGTRYTDEYWQAMAEWLRQLDSSP